MIQNRFSLGGLLETIPKNKMFLHSWVLDKRHFPTSFARFFWEKTRALCTRRLLESAILPGKNVISTRCFLVSANYHCPSSMANHAMPCRQCDFLERKEFLCKKKPFPSSIARLFLQKLVVTTRRLFETAIFLAQVFEAARCFLKPQISWKRKHFSSSRARFFLENER